ncbi:hypothetical protein D3C78_1939310 [compost metagenome]
MLIVVVRAFVGMHRDYTAASTNACVSDKLGEHRQVLPELLWQCIEAFRWMEDHRHVYELVGQAVANNK